MLLVIIPIYLYITINVCHSRLCEGTDDIPIFIRKVWDCSHMVIGALGGVGTYMTFERNDGI